jgi:hypothetical protein
VAGALLAASAVFAPSIVIAPSAWGEPSEETSLEQIKTSLDEIEADIGRDDITSEALADLRQKLNAAADALKGKIEELEPRTREVGSVSSSAPRRRRTRRPKPPRSPVNARILRRRSAPDGASSKPACSLRSIN